MEKLAVVRNTVVGAIDDPSCRIVREAESLAGERIEKIIEHGMALKLWDVFHGRDVGPEFADEPGEFLQQRPFWVFLVVESLRVFRERHAGCAANENANASFRIMFGEIVAGQFRHALAMKPCGGVVVFVGIATGIINVIASDDGNPSVEQSTSQSARTAE